MALGHPGVWSLDHSGRWTVLLSHDRPSGEITDSGPLGSPAGGGDGVLSWTTTAGRRRRAPMVRRPIGAVLTRAEPDTASD